MKIKYEDKFLNNSLLYGGGDIELNKGQIITITRKNGVGKTTFMKEFK